MQRKEPLSGFTIIELVISVAAISLMSVVLSQIFFSTLRTNTKTERIKEVKQNGELALEEIIRMVQGARAITSSCTATGQESDVLSFLDDTNEETTLSCLDDGLALRIASTSANQTYFVTSQNVTLGSVDCPSSSLVFRCFGGTGIPSTVKVSFRLAQIGTPEDQFETASADFQTTINMRNIPLQ